MRLSKRILWTMAPFTQYRANYLLGGVGMKRATGILVRGAWGRMAVAGLFILAALMIPLTTMQSQQPIPGYIQGTVRSSAGPEAGVWVIAETKDLATNYIKIVV